MKDEWDDPFWQEFVRNVRDNTMQMVADSHATVSIYPAHAETDVKFAVELGLSIMYDKPLIVLVPPGVRIPVHLQRVADEIVVCDIDTEDGQSKLGAALHRQLPEEGHEHAGR
jgi:hypothetical protein